MNNKMENEYSRWVALQNILSKFAPSINDKFTHIFIIMENWIMYEVSKYGIEAFDKNQYDFNELRRIMQFYKKEPMLPALQETIEFMFKNYQIVKKNPQNFNITKNTDFFEFQYGNFKTSITAKRINILRKFGDDEDIMKLALRYAFIQARGGNQWALPLHVYKNLIKYYKIEFEGFASPFNSLMLELTQKRNTYCSIFASDKQFGSRGSFFEQDFNNHRVFMNPPFISTFVADINKLIEKNNKGFYVLCFPTWEGKKCYDDLFKNKLYQCSYIYEAGKHYYEYEGRQVIAKFRTTFFIFSEKPIVNHLDQLY